MVNWSMPDYLGICFAYLFFSFLSALCISKTKTARLDFVLEQNTGEGRNCTLKQVAWRWPSSMAWEWDLASDKKGYPSSSNTSKCVRRKETYYSRCSIKINKSVCSPLNLQCLGWHACQSIFAELMSIWSRFSDHLDTSSCQ